MTNILGKNENLELFNKAGKRVYEYSEYSTGYSREFTFNDNGNSLTYKNSDGFSYECTYDEKGNQLTYKDSNGWSWEKTYDENNNELTYKNSKGVTRGFTTPEYTMEELTKMLGKNFKLIK